MPELASTLSVEHWTHRGQYREALRHPDPRHGEGLCQLAPRASTLLAYKHHDIVASYPFRFDAVFEQYCF